MILNKQKLDHMLQGLENPVLEPLTLQRDIVFIINSSCVAYPVPSLNNAKEPAHSLDLFTQHFCTSLLSLEMPQMGQY
jgi:hypothetical protein